MSDGAMPPNEVIPLLAEYWKRDQFAAAEKFREFIDYSEKVKKPLMALVYRCALVQLKYNYGLHVIDGMGFDEARLKQEAGA